MSRNYQRQKIIRILERKYSKFCLEPIMMTCCYIDQFMWPVAVIFYIIKRHIVVYTHKPLYAPEIKCKGLFNICLRVSDDGLLGLFDHSCNTITNKQFGVYFSQSLHTYECMRYCSCSFPAHWKVVPARQLEHCPPCSCLLKQRRANPRLTLSSNYKSGPIVARMTVKYSSISHWERDETASFMERIKRYKPVVTASV